MKQTNQTLADRITKEANRLDAEALQMKMAASNFRKAANIILRRPVGRPKKAEAK